MFFLKNILRHFFELLICLWSKVYTIDISVRIKTYRNYFYTLWISHFLGALGHNSSIYYPCSLWGKGQKRIKIGNNTLIQSYSILGCWISYGTQKFAPEIIIGDDCNIGQHTHISAINRITIGNGLLTGRYVYIGDNNHGGLSTNESNTPPVKRKLQSKGEIVIGNNVWIGDKATILGGVHIGDNVIIGANSVVTHDIPSNSMAAGMPAKVIKHLELCQNQD